MTSQRYDYYNDPGCGAFARLTRTFPEFSNVDFAAFVVAHNKGDRDDGELNDIAAHEVLRLAAEFAESRWRFAGASVMLLAAPR